MIRNGILIHTSENSDENPALSYVLAAKLAIGDQKYLARLVILEDSNGRRFYNHELIRHKKLGEASQRGAASQSEVGTSAPLRALSNTREMGSRSTGTQDDLPFKTSPKHSINSPSATRVEAFRPLQTRQRVKLSGSRREWNCTGSK